MEAHSNMSTKKTKNNYLENLRGSFSAGRRTASLVLSSVLVPASSPNLLNSRCTNLHALNCKIGFP